MIDPHRRSSRKVAVVVVVVGEHPASSALVMHRQAEVVQRLEGRRA